MLIALLLHVAVAVPETPLAPAAVFRAAVVEAAAIWAPYGVAIDDAAALCGRATGDRIMLAVIPATVPAQTHRSPMASPWLRPLGSIAFAPDGAPEPAITVFLAAIQQVIAGTAVLGTSPWQRPRWLREQLLGRVLGRVLAHEIGHFLLRSPQHAADGLMRPRQLGRELVSPQRHRFTLTVADVARLEDRR